MDSVLTSLAVFSLGTIYISVFYKMKFGDLVEFLTLATFGSERIKSTVIQLFWRIHI